MKPIVSAAIIILALLVEFTHSKLPSNYTLIRQNAKRMQQTLHPLPAEPRQRPLAERPSWSNPPTIQWIDDPPADSNTHLLPVLYLMAPLVVTAMLMPIGATLIATMFMLKANNPSSATGSFKSLLFPKEEEVAPVFKILEQNLLDLLKKVEEAILKYDNNNL